MRLIYSFLLLGVFATSLAISQNDIPQGFATEYFNQLPSVLQKIVLDYMPLPKAPVINPPRPIPSFNLLLAMDGGGIRGLIGCIQLMSLTKAIKEIMLEDPKAYGLPSSVTALHQFDVNLPTLFDAFTGVSAGSYMTGILTTNGANLQNALPAVEAFGLQPSSPIAIMFMWLELIKISSKNPIDPATNETYVSTGLSGAQILDPFLANIFGPNTVMSACLKSTYIGATDIEATNSIGFYKNVLNGDVGTIIPTSESLVGGRAGTDPLFSERAAETSQDHPGREFLLWQVARASSAIPTLALPFQIQTVSPTKPIDGGSWILVDGALTHNNPVAIAVSFLMRTGNVNDLNKLAVLSLGTTRCGPNITTLGEYYNIVQNLFFAYGTGADDSNPHGNLVQQLLNGKADQLPANSTVPGRYLRINRNFERSKIQYIQDPAMRAQYAKFCQAAYTGSDPVVLGEIGVVLAEEYYPTLKTWTHLYMFGSAL
jgi:hypothetical protein